MTEFNLYYTLILLVIVFAVIMGSVAYLTFAERKISAYMQDRIGPNRVGPWGLLQPLADGLKFFFKEDIIPKHVDRIFYFLAPGVGVATALLAFSIVPFGPSTPVPAPVSVVAEGSVEKATEKYEAGMNAYREQRTFALAPGLEIGILFSFALGSLVVYGIILGGWSGNNKYSLLGALRSSAQIISYEIPLGMSALGIVLFAGFWRTKQRTAGSSSINRSRSYCSWSPCMPNVIACPSICPKRNKNSSAGSTPNMAR
jgi:NADH-quinone oxidoreductase subunit H